MRAKLSVHVGLVSYIIVSGTHIPVQQQSGCFIFSSVVICLLIFILNICMFIQATNVVCTFSKH